MTPEAQNYLRKLFKEDSHKFIEINEDSRRGITSAVLNEIALTADEIDYIRFFIKNGSPTLVIEYRPNERGLSSNPSSIFIDGKEIPVGVKLNIPGYVNDNKEFEKFEKAYAAAPGGMKLYHKNGETTFHGEIFQGMTEKRLREKLKEEEAKENYEMCQELMKYAEYKGWDLKKQF